MIVLNWNGADDSIACIDSLCAQHADIPDIILVDNASSDDSVERFEEYIVQHKKTHIQLIKSETNTGFAGGINQGVTAALERGYEYIGTLNPDATADENWTRALIDELERHKDAGIAGGQLQRSDKKTLDSTGDFYTTWGIPGPRGREQSVETAPTESEAVFGITGGGFIARAELFRAVGLFDEAFFMYFEDVDLCFRAQLRGYKIRYTPHAIAYHKISASTNKVPGLAVKQTFKNLPLLFWKNVPRGLMPVILPRFFISYTLILGHAIAKGRGGPAIDGFFRSLTLLPHALRERKNIQSSRTVSDDYIDSIILHDIPPEQTGLRKFRAIFTGRR